MAYNDQEISSYGGAPVELFLFRDSAGQAVEALTTGEDEVLDGLVLYRPGVVNRTSIRQTSEETTGNIEIRVPADSSFAQRFKAYLPAKPISVLVYRYHATDLAVQRRTVFIGSVTAIDFDSEGIATVACTPVTTAMGKKVPWQVYKKGCNWALYGHGCGVLRASFETPVLTYSTSGDTLTSAAVDALPDGWFRHGYVEVVSTGERRFVLEHLGGTLTLEYPFFNLPAGEALTVVAGCDRSEETCRDKFNNLPNYLGFDYIPDTNPYDTNFGPSGTPNAGTTIPLPGFGEVTIEG